MAPTTPTSGATAALTKLKIKPVGRVPKTADEASGNWNALKDLVKDRPKKRSPKYRNPVLLKTNPRSTPNAGTTVTQSKSAEAGPSNANSNSLDKFNFPNYDAAGQLLGIPISPALTKPTWCLALDCEMVGVGPMKESALARVSVVNENGVCLLDRFVKPKARITDYRTAVSGIREEHMIDADSFENVTREVAALLTGHVVVGHAVHHDFKALMFTHPRGKIRDTSIFFRSVFKRTPALKALALKFLNIEIQTGEHSSIQDAQVTMKLYLLHRKEWEDKHNSVRHRRRGLRSSATAANATDANKQPA